MTTPDPIPESVLEILETVRSGGETNMLARNTVIRLALEEADDTEETQDRQAVSWLVDNQSRYMEALTAMGERRQ